MSDGITIIPDIMNWKYFSYPVTFQTLAFLALTAAGSRDGAIVVSVREMAKQLHNVTYKEVRIAMEHLQKESIINTEKQGRYTIVRFQQWHSLSRCLLPYTAQPMAQSEAQSAVLQLLESQAVGMDSQTTKGAISGALKGANENGAQSRAQSRAQSQSLETPANTDVSEDSENGKGAIEGANMGALVGKRNKKEKSLSPAPLSKKENNKEKGRKKIKTPDGFFEELNERFNALFRGTKIPQCTRMTDDRKLLVKHFIDDYSIEAIETLLQKVAASTDLMNPKRKGNTPFNWIFAPKNYTDIMEGSYDDFEPQQKEQQVQPQQQPIQEGPQHVETKEEREKRQLQEHRNRLQGLADLAMRPDAGQFTMQAAMDAYKSGKFKELGIDFTPPSAAVPDTSLSGASAADIINSDPEGYLASILKQ